MRDDLSNLAHWFPILQAAGVPVPRTEIVTTKIDLGPLLDGRIPEGYDDFCGELVEACRRIGLGFAVRDQRLGPTTRTIGSKSALMTFTLTAFPACS